jgi:hypothetical protein
MDGTQSKDQIFICYRRDDSAGVTGRIYDRLVQRFGDQAVFKDIDSIPLGANFKQHIDSVIAQCSVVVVVIGDRWIANGRINDPADYVRIEVESAFQRQIPVIPLLVQNASMPAEEDLPESLRELRYRHGIPINNDPHFHVDMNRLIKSLEDILIPKPGHGPGTTASAPQATGGQMEPKLAEPLLLKRGEPVFLYGGEWRIVLDHTYTSLRNINATAYIEGERRSLDLYADKRYSMSWGGNDYYLDLISVESESAVLRITKRGA